MVITINFIHNGTHEGILKNMIKGFKICNINYVINGNIKDYKYIYSPSTFINPDTHKDKYIIFGPQFTSFNKLNQVKSKNCLYIQPSKQSINIRRNLGFTEMDIQPHFVGVDYKSINISNRNGNPILYYKMREPSEFLQLKQFLKTQSINYNLIVYGKYKSNDYHRLLSEAPYMIVLDRGESQGFALQECMSANVPLFLWDVQTRAQEYPFPPSKKLVKHLPYTSVPYWNDICGMRVFNLPELKQKFNIFLNNLDNYQPRGYVINNLSLEKSTENLLDLFLKCSGTEKKNIKFKTDYFLIWNHGIKNINEITKIISKYEDLEIVEIIKYKINDLQNFIHHLYLFDDKNKDHIKNKTKYLHTLPKDIIIISLKNYSLQSDVYEYSQKVKWEIRAKFNPQFPNPKHHPHKALPPGVTHNHVIHSCDTEKEAKYLLNYITKQQTNYNISPNNIAMQFVNKPELTYNFQEYEKKLRNKVFFKDYESQNKVRLSNLIDVRDVLKKHNINYWLTGKTLLGVYKNKTFINNDHDDDIAIDVSDACKLKAIHDDLISKNFKLIRISRKDTIFSMMRNNRYIDICIFRTSGNTYGYEQKYYPKKYYTSFTNCMIKDQNITIPTQSKELLKIMYSL